ncbi:hypothetical protein ACFVY1_46400 [Streptomyces sp. NPDC058293]|uniref:hypothetical protein n=1 Tax=Streptomyces sp. NPDC058293 TaxID=3346429 RepID=UPI0036F16ECC
MLADGGFVACPSKEREARPDGWRRVDFTDLRHGVISSWRPGDGQADRGAHEVQLRPQQKRESERQ